MSISERFAANVAWLFAELPWTQRFAAARGAGFAAVEFPWPDDPGTTETAVARAGLRVALLNAPAGDLAAGDRGWPNDPARVDEWRDAFDDALELAAAVGCPTVNVLAGNRLAAVAEHAQRECLEENLRWALGRAAAGAVTVVSELLNLRENHDYLLATLDEAEPLMARLGPLGWRLQLDTWHIAATDEDVPAALRRAGDRIGHVQLADAPGRHEPGSGALDWGAIREALDGYAGAIGLEYRPRGDTLAGLREATVLAEWFSGA